VCGFWAVEAAGYGFQSGTPEKRQEQEGGASRRARRYPASFALR
jgi:hypothetical protein